MKTPKIDSYWLFTHEDESYKDFKIPRNEVRFPSHVGEKLNGEVKVYSVEELHNQK